MKGCEKSMTSRCKFLTAVCLAVAVSLLLPAVAGAAMKTLKAGTRQAVSMRKPESTAAAWAILEKGGNAFDAIVAGQAVNGIVDPSMNGMLGADMVTTFYVAAEKKVWFLDCEGTAPALATIEWYEENSRGEIPASDGLLSGTVPGIVAGWCYLLDKWGTMTLTEVLEPAIQLAEQGFPSTIWPTADKLMKYPSTVENLVKPNEGAKPYDLLKFPQIAATMRKLVAAEQAALKAGKSRSEALRAARDEFYKGSIAREMADFSEKNGGLFRYEDFANYEVKLREPAVLDYKGYKVYTQSSSSQGGTVLIWLNILKNFDLKALKHNSVEYLHLLAETGKLAYADREWLADIDFYPVPWKGLLSEEYGKDRAKLVDMTQANNDLRVGNPWPYQGSKTPPNPWGLTDEQQAAVQVANADVFDAEFLHGDTSGVSCADRWGNVIVMTPSLHSGWGTGVVMGNTGVIFNCRGDYFFLDPDHPSALRPGSRPRSTLMTTLVCDAQNRPVFTIASPGGDDQPQIAVQAFLNFFEFGMDLQEAIEAPRMDLGSFPGSVFPHPFYAGRVEFESRIPADVQEKLAEMGHKVASPPPGPYSKGSQHGLALDYSRPGVVIYFAGADPRSTIDAMAK